MNLRPVAVWFMIMLAECVHGLIRALFLKEMLGDRVSHQVGVAVGSVLVVAITVVSIRWMAVGTTRWLLAVGVLWAALTMLFEVAAGRVFFDGGFERVLADYDPRRGGLMLLGMVVLALSPWVIARLLGIENEGLNDSDK